MSKRKQPAMSDEDFAKALMHLETLVGLALDIDLNNLVKSLTRASLLEPLINPSLRGGGGEGTAHSPKEWLEMAEAALHLQKVASRHAKAIRG